MKILIDARMYGLENVGIGRYLINLIAQLVELNTLDSYIILLRNKYYQSLTLPKNWKKVEADFQHYSWSEQLMLPEIINKEKPDLVHFPHINTPIFWKGKYILTVHDLTMQRQGANATSLPIPIYYFKRIPFLFSANLSVNRAAKIITPSRTVKQDLINYYKIDPAKVENIYEGVNYLMGNETLNKKYRLEKPYFFYIGNAYPHKNLGMAVEAIRILNENLKTKASLVIAGSRDVFKVRLEKLIKESRSADYVKLLGYIPDSDLKALYWNSIAFIYPSLSEGFGLQGLEALAAGTLLIASDIETFKEIYGNCAFYFEPKNSNNVAAVMKKVLSLDKAVRENNVKKSTLFIKRYSWKKMAGETLKIYRETVK